LWRTPLAEDLHVYGLFHYVDRLSMCVRVYCTDHVKHVLFNNGRHHNAVYRLKGQPPLNVYIHVHTCIYTICTLLEAFPSYIYHIQCWRTSPAQSIWPQCCFVIGLGNVLYRDYRWHNRISITQRSWTKMKTQNYLTQELSCNPSWHNTVYVHVAPG
jgi:hypothetical protein